MITYPTFQQALSPQDETIYFVSDDDGKPVLRFDDKLGYFILVLPLTADLHKLMHRSNWEMKEAIARHPRATPEILLELSAHKDPQVREAARSHPSFPGNRKTTKTSNKFLVAA